MLGGDADPDGAAEQEEAAVEGYDVYNRFKELQKIYKERFKYTFLKMDLKVQCQICYLPFEGRLDQETFELILQNTMP